MWLYASFFSAEHKERENIVGKKQPDKTAGDDFDFDFSFIRNITRMWNPTKKNLSFDREKKISYQVTSIITIFYPYMYAIRQVQVRQTKSFDWIN